MQFWVIFIIAHQDVVCPKLSPPGPHLTLFDCSPHRHDTVLDRVAWCGLVGARLKLFKAFWIIFYLL